MDPMGYDEAIGVDPEVNLSEFKSCLLAALRSTLPQVWTPKHEDAWLPTVGRDVLRPENWLKQHGDTTI